MWTVVLRYHGQWIIPYRVREEFPEGLTHGEASTMRYCEYDRYAEADCKVVTLAEAEALTLAEAA